MCIRDSYTYQAAFVFGLCTGTINGVGAMYVNKQVTTMAALGYTLFNGNYSQTAWGYLTSKHPAQALNYRGIAYIANPAYQLGNSPQIPNHNVVVAGRFSNGDAGADADASLVINYLLTDPKSGAGFPSSKLNALTIYQNYVMANGLFVSPAYVQQAPASSILKDLQDATNSAFVFSGGMLSLVPYGDQSITANGYTYTAPSSPQYSVTDDDFVAQPGTDPVQPTRCPTSDIYNSVQLECLDPSNQYNPAVIGAKDQAAIDTYGLKEQTITAHYFANLSAARLSAQLWLQRGLKRNTYAFTLDHRYVLLDPMDIIAITDTTLGLNAVLVRIISIDEDDNGNFAMVAEEYLGGNGSSPLHTFQTGLGYTTDYNSDPGNVNPPVLF